MTEETIAMTQKATDRLSVIQQVVNRQLRQREAAVQLVRIPRQRDRRFQTNVTAHSNGS